MRTPYQLATTPQGTPYVTADAQGFNQLVLQNMHVFASTLGHETHTVQYNDQTQTWGLDIETLANHAKRFINAGIKQAHLTKQARPADIDTLVAQAVNIRNGVITPDALVTPSTRYVVFANGTLDTNTGRLIETNIKNYAMNSVNANYDLRLATDTETLQTLLPQFYAIMTPEQVTDVLRFIGYLVSSRKTDERLTLTMPADMWLDAIMQDLLNQILCDYDYIEIAHQQAPRRYNRAVYQLAIGDKFIYTTERPQKPFSARLGDGGITVQLSPENASDGTLLAVRPLSDHELDIVANTTVALYQK